MADSPETTPVLEVVRGSDEEVEEVLRQEKELPEAMPVLPLRDTVAYPDTLAPLGVGQERSIKLVDDVLAGNRMLVMVASRDPEEDTPNPDQLHDVGVEETRRPAVEGERRDRHLAELPPQRRFVGIAELPEGVAEHLDQPVAAGVVVGDQFVDGRHETTGSNLTART